MRVYWMDCIKKGLCNDRSMKKALSGQAGTTLRIIDNPMRGHPHFPYQTFIFTEKAHADTAATCFSECPCGCGRWPHPSHARLNK